MLDRNKLVIKLNQAAPEIFEDRRGKSELVQALWRKLVADPLLKQKLKSAKTPWALPTWSDVLDEVFSISQACYSYDLISVDGSQIYPDRHSGVSCYLINIGEVVFQYGQERSVMFHTTPYVFNGNDEEISELSLEFINAKRQDLELKAGYMQAQKIKTNKQKHLLLFDGTLIFWHLEAKDPLLKEIFLSRYLSTLVAMQQEGILCASYISAPKSKELMSIVKTYGSQVDQYDEEKIATIARFTDSSLLALLLKQGERTIVFENHAKVSELYPAAIHPHFFYIHTGVEIGRVEIPAWIAQNEPLVEWIASVIFDQCDKGYGYPIALAEAHEQAVVKSPDRDFFYHLLQKMSISRKQRILVSRKAAKKRGMGI